MKARGEYAVIESFSKVFTANKSLLVNKKVLAHTAQNIGLGKHIYAQEKCCE